MNINALYDLQLKTLDIWLARWKLNQHISI